MFWRKQNRGPGTRTDMMHEAWKHYFLTIYEFLTKSQQGDSLSLFVVVVSFWNLVLIWMKLNWRGNFWGYFFTWHSEIELYFVELFERFLKIIQLELSYLFESFLIKVLNLTILSFFYENCLHNPSQTFSKLSYPAIIQSNWMPTFIKMYGKFP